ncbi:ElyC/SanA/YdcF family protein [Lyngbya aestuarii]|uniref:ElyC/SanA/YdcF family protein n=1 Tax=Lyngbya aestuarii TaxID=118322 RepID=UPI00403DACEF
MRLVHQQNKWTLTIQGRLVAAVSSIALMWFMLTNIHPFLAVDHPIKADILVVEGWLPDFAVKEAIAEFERGGYQKLVTTGTPLEKGFYLAQYDNFAELTAATLVELGFDRDRLVAVPAPEVVRNRTAASAIALRQWIRNSGLKIQSINLYTYDVHARRSWLVFKQTLAPSVKVGVISVKAISYEPKKWWISSAGVRTIISETVAYIYARFVDWRS